MADLISENIDYDFLNSYEKPSVTKKKIICAACNASEICCVFSNCLHLCCQRCLQNLKVDESYRCPSCKETSDKRSTKLPTCNWCEDNGEHTMSIGQCEDCDIWLCGECLKGHNRMPPLRNHSIITGKTENQGVLRCESHPNEALECFCEACGVLTCRDCQLSIHRDHGSHRWVGEKAALMRSPLEDSIKVLESVNHKLTLARELTQKAKLDINGDSLVSSIEKARQDIESRAELLIQIIQEYSQQCLTDLDDTANQSFSQLTFTETLIENLQEQLSYTETFGNYLIKVTENDPASLVQLYETVQGRINSLQNRAAEILEDSPLSTLKPDSVQTNDSLDFDECRKQTVGWRNTVNTRALFIGHLNADNLVKFLGTIAWLPKPNQFDENRSNGFTTEEAEVNNDFENVVKPVNDCLSETVNDFLDSLAEIDRLKTNGNAVNTTTASHLHLDSDSQCENGQSDSASVGPGCAICFGVGLLVHCSKCQRAYHLDCHLPRLNILQLNPGWVCGLCVKDDVLFGSLNGKLLKSSLPTEDYLIGCRILMGLLVHPEGVHFTASICPACSAPLLLNPAKRGASLTPCPVGHLYHRLSELRMQLEENESVTNGHSTKEDKSCPDSSSKTINSSLFQTTEKQKITCLGDWLTELDKFLLDVYNETEIRGATKGSLRAARRLRSYLCSLVRQYRPDLESSLLLIPTDVENGRQTVLDNGSLTCGVGPEEVTPSCGSDPPISPDNCDSEASLNIVIPTPTSNNPGV